ncbi:hypothetical protein [Roseomonas fluvialis]|uniref:Uncharacterized protein n=1 Tax=Roseomonas fluvialis TaxID=1750527 RepID=A0ABM7XXP8_9PROT|nr:hypothetical protein [Roseomonas fluvialis]BDG70246.1 hypothetical protein Rmf_01750 [Roseomonas fluvialis]
MTMAKNPSEMLRALIASTGFNDPDRQHARLMERQENRRQVLASGWMWLRVSHSIDTSPDKAILDAELLPHGFHPASSIADGVGVGIAAPPGAKAYLVWRDSCEDWEEPDYFNIDLWLAVPVERPADDDSELKPVDGGREAQRSMSKIISRIRGRHLPPRDTLLDMLVAKMLGFRWGEPSEECALAFHRIAEANPGFGRREGVIQVLDDLLAKFSDHDLDAMLRIVNEDGPLADDVAQAAVILRLMAK